MNAKKELLSVFEIIEKNIEDVAAIQIAIINNVSDLDTVLKTDNLKESDLDNLNFNYICDTGVRVLQGKVLFKDNTWLERTNQGCLEYWCYHKPPTVSEIIKSNY